MNDLQTKFYVMADDELFSSAPNVFTRLAGGIAHGSRSTGKTADQVIHGCLVRVLEDLNIKCRVSARKSDKVYYSHYAIEFKSTEDRMAYELISHQEIRKRMIDIIESYLDKL